MRRSYFQLCITVSSLVVVNFFLFVIFPPRNWKLGKLFGFSEYGYDISLLKNITVVEYELKLRSVAGMDSCQEKSELLVGNITVNMDTAEENYWTLSKYLRPNGTLQNGTSMGSLEDVKENGTSLNYISVFQPAVCNPIRNVAFIIPFRDRESHLRILLGHLVPILQKQQIRYSIFVVEQLGEGTFNKGRLMNTGYKFAYAVGKKFEMPYTCYVFQDVDLLAENDNLLYKCSGGKLVDHLSTSIDKFDYKMLCCGMTVGGVLAMTDYQYEKVNGFPNSYWGWGGEDDDINKRIRFRRMQIARPKEILGRYKMIKHGPDSGNPYNKNVHRNVQLAIRRFRRDGLSSLRTSIVRIENYPIFTRIIVDVGKP